MTTSYIFFFLRTGGKLCASPIATHLSITYNFSTDINTVSRKTITSLLENGTTVICDRYYYSGMVYSAAKGNPALSLSWARTPEVGLPRPDLVIFLDLDEEQAKKRGGWGDELYEKAEMQRRVKDLFWGLSFGRIDVKGVVKSGEERTDSTVGLTFRQEEEDLSVVDASSGAEEVANSIWKIARPRISAVERGEAGRTVRRVS